MRNPPRGAHPSVARLGISVVEVLVALMLITVGLLGVAGSSALALRSALDATRQREAIRVAANRFALVASKGCGASVSGSSADSVRQMTEWWSVASSRNGFATMRDSLQWMSGRGVRRLAIQSALRC
jgi:Tfp pilus assembly protein PilV